MPSKPALDYKPQYVHKKLHGLQKRGNKFTSFNLFGTSTVDSYNDRFIYIYIYMLNKQKQ
jgi:hypothetical protein